MNDNDKIVKDIFAKNIQILRGKKGLTQKEFGDILGVGISTISDWEKAKKLPRAGMIEQISMSFNIPKSLLFEKPGTVYHAYGKLINLPIVGKISCGNGSLAYEEIEDYEPTPEAWLNGGEYFYLRAKGDSMVNSRIFDGDLVLIRRQEEVENGQIGVVVIDDVAYLKKIHKHDHVIKLESSNPLYSVIECDAKEQTCRIVGKLKKIIVNI